MYWKLSLLTAGLAALVACPTTDGGFDDSGCDTAGDCGDPGDVEVLIQEVNWDCLSSNGPWHYDATTSGWTTDGLLYVTQDTTPAYEEEHNIPSVDSDPNGEWDYLEKELPVVTNFNDQVNDVNTLFRCDNGTENTMTWQLTVYDLDDNPADCAVFYGSNGEPTLAPNYSSCCDFINGNNCG